MHVLGSVCHVLFTVTTQLCHWNMKVTLDIDKKVGVTKESCLVQIFDLSLLCDFGGKKITHKIKITIYSSHMAITVFLLSSHMARVIKLYQLCFLKMFNVNSALLQVFEGMFLHHNHSFGLYLHNCPQWQNIYFWQKQLSPNHMKGRDSSLSLNRFSLKHRYSTH